MWSRKDIRFEGDAPGLARDVVLERCLDYEASVVDRAVESMTARLGGLRGVVNGREVILKPNLLMPKRPEQAVNTHPQLICSVARAVLKAGARRVVVADSPAVGKAKWVANRLGLQQLLDPLGVAIEELTEEVEVELDPKFGQKIKLSKRLLEAETVINLAKLKSHGLCGLTMAVKNCFGAVLGLDKTRWHLKAGRNTYLFASMLTKVCRKVAPGLSIVDAVESMDGNGPSSGRVRKTGFLAAGRDPFALDRVLAAVCGVAPEGVTTFAHDGSLDIGKIPVRGASIAELKISDWQMPAKKAGGFFRIVERYFPSWLARGYGAEPRFSNKLCTLCLQCIKICPAKALSERRKKVKINKDHCIRCFCCQELCPEGAIRVGR